MSEPHLVGGRELWRERRISKADIVAAREWYREQGAKIRNVNVNKVMSEQPERLFSRVTQGDIGSMVHFFYDPKHKATLPYWDQFPLVFPIQDYGKNFLGINLHYLPPNARAKLMDALYQCGQKNKNNEITRLNISYRILKNASRMGAFKPCVKEYIKTHVKSRFFYIAPSEWDLALMLPTARFVGATNQQVWRDSNKAI